MEKIAFGGLEDRFDYENRTSKVMLVNKGLQKLRNLGNRNVLPVRRANLAKQLSYANNYKSPYYCKFETHPHPSSKAGSNCTALGVLYVAEQSLYSLPRELMFCSSALVNVQQQALPEGERSVWYVE